jgi:hypothetical protein
MGFRPVLAERKLNRQKKLNHRERQERRGKEVKSGKFQVERTVAEVRPDKRHVWAVNLALLG